MATFISLNAVRSGQNGTRPVQVCVENIAYYVAAGETYDVNGNTTIVFIGTTGANDEKPLIVRQTVAEVTSAITAAAG